MLCRNFTLWYYWAREASHFRFYHALWVTRRSCEGTRRARRPSFLISVPSSRRDVASGQPFCAFAYRRWEYFKWPAFIKISLISIMKRAKKNAYEGRYDAWRFIRVRIGRLMMEYLIASTFGPDRILSYLIFMHGTRPCAYDSSLLRARAVTHMKRFTDKYMVDDRYIYDTTWTYWGKHRLARLAADDEMHYSAEYWRHHPALPLRR